MAFTRRELLTNGVMGSAAFGGFSGVEPAGVDAAEEREINQTLKSLVAEFERPQHSMLPGDVNHVSRLRDQMLEFLKATSRWPDYIDVGAGPWFAIYDWHVRFGVAPAVVRLPDNRYGLTFMFTTLVLRPEHAQTHIGYGYDKER